MSHLQRLPTSLGNLTASVTGADDFKEQQELLLSPQISRMKIPTSDDLSANGCLKGSAGTSREDHVGNTSVTVADAVWTPAERNEPGAGHKRQPPVQAELLRETAVPAAATPRPPATGQEHPEKQQSKEKLLWQVELPPALGASLPPAVGSKKVSSGASGRCPDQNWDGWCGRASAEQQALGNAARAGGGASQQQQRPPAPEDPSPAQFLSELVSLGKEVRDHMRVLLRAATSADGPSAASDPGANRSAGHALVVPEALPVRADTVYRHNL